MRKGVSPFIASVLLIAFAIAVAGIYSGWITSFTEETTEKVGERSEKRVTCSYGGIVLSDPLYYNRTSRNLSGWVENTDIISLGNIDLEIFYVDDTRDKLDMNMSLSPGERNTFNENVPKLNDTDCTEIRVITNCSNVYDTISC